MLRDLRGRFFFFFFLNFAFFHFTYSILTFSSVRILPTRKPLYITSDRLFLFWSICTCCAFFGSSVFMIPFTEPRSVRAYPRVHLRLTGQWEWHGCRGGMVFVKWRSGGFGSCLWFLPASLHL